MSILTGKEALIALANGQEIEARHKQTGMGWSNAMTLNLFSFKSSMFEFRLKPQTIAINGIEVPACGDDYKPHTFMFVLNSLEPCEYSKIILDESDEIPPYWWKSEEEIKQVVAALRQVFGGAK